MRPFAFSLQAVRTMRQRQEQLALAEFGDAVRARQAAVDQQQRAERQLAVAFDQLTARQSEGAPLYHLNQMRGHCQVLEQRLVSCRADCVKAQEVANAAWERLQDIRQALELVDKLYLRQRELYEHELRAEEQKQLDEMSSRRWLLSAASAQNMTLAWN
jgi:flagellar export protein FliJ